MALRNVQAVAVSIMGFVWICSGLDHTGLEQLIRLATGSVLLGLSLVLLEMAAWRRM